MLTNASPPRSTLTQVQPSGEGEQAAHPAPVWEDTIQRPDPTILSAIMRAGGENKSLP